MFPPKKEAFWLPIFYGVVAGVFAYLGGSAFSSLDGATPDTAIMTGKVLAGVFGLMFYLGGLMFWLPIVKMYEIPAYLRESPREEEIIEEPAEEDDHERYTGTYDETISFTNPVDDLQLYLFAKGISDGASTVYSRWTTAQGDDPAVFNSDEFHVLRTWLIKKGYAAPIAKGEIDMTEYGKHFLSLIATTHIHSPTPRSNVEPVRSAPFVTIKEGRG